MKKMILILLSSFFLGLGLTINTSFSASHGERPPQIKNEKNDKADHKYDKRGEWLNDLGLDDQQKKKIEILWQQKKATIEKLLAQKNALKEELGHTLRSEAKEDQARQIHSKLQDVKRELGNAHFESTLSIRKLLNPQQRILFFDKMKLLFTEKPH